jgi:hypothetical protein
MSDVGSEGTAAAQQVVCHCLHAVFVCVIAALGTGLCLCGRHRLMQLTAALTVLLLDVQA